MQKNAKCNRRAYEGRRRSIRKGLLFLLLVIGIQATAVSQTVTLSGKELPLEKVFNDITIQTNFYVVYDPSLLEVAKPVNVNAKKVPLTAFLDQILQNQPFSYLIKKTTIFITQKPVITDHSDKVPVAGQITDTAGNPVGGVSVVVKGTGKGTVSDVNGYFSVNADAGQTLLIRSVEYVPRELDITSETVALASAHRMLKIKLSKSVVILEAYAVNAGYYTVKPQEITGSISTVRSAAITSQPVSNPILALTGKVTGLFITPNAGFAGANITVNIRGQNSLSNLTSAPLYIIDGIPFGSGPVEQSVGGYQATVGFSPLNTIDPGSIESITVLKDADATAIYGSRGAAGVILITTKKGEAGSTKLTVDVSGGMGKVTNLVKMAGTEQYLNIRNEAFANDGITPTSANAPDLKLWPQTGYTDFGKLIIGQTSHQTKATASLSGGNKYTQFLFSGNYRYESTVYNKQTSDKAGQFNFNVQHRDLSGKFGINVSVKYNVDNNTIPNYTINQLNYSLPPNYPLYNDNGGLYFGPGYTSPLAAFNVSNNLKSANFIANTVAHYNIWRDLDLKVSLGYNKINVDGAIITPAAASNPLSNYTQTSTLNSNNISTYIAEPQLNYSHIWNKSKLTALLGGSLQETRTEQPYFVLGSFNNILLAKSLAALTVLLKSSGFTDYKYNSGFVRVSYDLDNKYIISANVRRDGSSRFGANRQLGNFGSIAGAWLFSNERFIKYSLPWLSYGKLRASYGTIGNDRIQDYSYESTYASTLAYGSINGFAPSRIANPNLQWEVTKKLDVAMELGFMKDRLLLSANVYRNRSNNLLGTTLLAAQVGFGNYNSNLPATIQNRGLELEATGVIIKSKNLSWTTSVNLTLPENKLLALPDLTISSLASSYIVGQSLNYITGYHFTGFVNGIATAQDINKDGTITTGLAKNGLGDYIVIGNSDPKLYGGLSSSLSYKGFQLDVFFQGVKRMATRGDLGLSPQPGMGYNTAASLLDLPVKYTATAGSPSATAWRYYTSSDAALQDASYIRLRNVSLAYNFRADWLKRLKLTALQVYMNGQNLLTFTHYKGLDPETFNALPPLKMVIAGIKITFN